MAYDILMQDEQPAEDDGVSTPPEQPMEGDGSDEGNNGDMDAPAV